MMVMTAWKEMVKASEISGREVLSAQWVAMLLGLNSINGYVSVSESAISSSYPAMNINNPF